MSGEGFERGTSEACWGEKGKKKKKGCFVLVYICSVCAHRDRHSSVCTYGVMQSNSNLRVSCSHLLSTLHTVTQRQSHSALLQLRRPIAIVFCLIRNCFSRYLATDVPLHGSVYAIWERWNHLSAGVFPLALPHWPLFSTTRDTHSSFFGLWLIIYLMFASVTKWIKSLLLSRRTCFTLFRERGWVGGRMLIMMLSCFFL